MPRRSRHHVVLHRGRHRHGHRDQSPAHGGRRYYRSRSDSGSCKRGPKRGRAWRKNANVTVYRPSKPKNQEENNNNNNNKPKPDPHTDLKVESLDLLVAKNAKAHRTSEYDCVEKGRCVVRRGQCFDIQLTFNKPYNATTDDLRLVFELGDNPSAAKGTEVEIILSDKDEPNKWGAKILKGQDNSLWVTVFTPPACQVGCWELSVDVVKAKDNDVTVFRYEHEDTVTILFNPWNKDDAVYMEDERLLQEYVMNESGRIFTGNKHQQSYKPWNFGQFEEHVLDVALELLDRVSLKAANRGNPVAVVRKLSAAVNSSDDDGVLTGNWSGDYSGGRSPLSWTGSAKILQQYHNTGRPVEYGQCWVFSGLCTTVCRALGLPTRSVTNFASAHDTDGSITIDVYFNKDGEPEDSSDSIWNFHVWNEAWMARPDLPGNFGGWQAFDATPQEASDGIYCCGPVSVAALRQGEVTLPYDAPFVFAEVNADRCFWMPGHSGTLKCVKKKTADVGHKISTKAPLSPAREDITLQYKPAEGSAEERACVLKANQLASNRPDVYERCKPDVMFEVVQDQENTWVGDDFNVELKVSSVSREPRTVSGRLVVSSMYYTGVMGDRLVSQPFSFKLDGGQTQQQQIGQNKKNGQCDKVKVSISGKFYVEKLKDCCMLDVSVWATVAETKQSFVAKEDFRLRKPHLTITGPGEVMKGEEAEFQVTFSNPLPTPLTDCCLSVDGLARSLDFPQKNVPAKGTFMTTIPVTAFKVGHKELVLVFSSRQLDDINGTKDMFVRAQN